MVVSKKSFLSGFWGTCGVMVAIGILLLIVLAAGLFYVAHIGANL